MNRGSSTVLWQLSVAMRAAVGALVIAGCQPAEVDEEYPENDIPFSGADPYDEVDSAATASVAFAHPGVLVSQKQINFLKSKTTAEPWKSALKGAKESRFGSLSYKPHPVANVICGPFSNPDVGCTDELND